ncbi:MAG: hypothetical protein ABIB71_02800 [Candidatus Woesearchaeota archaeon]
MGISDKTSHFDNLGFIPKRWDNEKRFLNRTKGSIEDFFFLQEIAKEGNFNPTLEGKPIEISLIEDITPALEKTRDIYGYYPMYSHAFTTKDMEYGGLLVKKAWGCPSFILIHEDNHATDDRTMVHELVHQARLTLNQWPVASSLADECYAIRAGALSNTQSFVHQFFYTYYDDCIAKLGEDNLNFLKKEGVITGERTHDSFMFSLLYSNEEMFRRFLYPWTASTLEEEYVPKNYPHSASAFLFGGTLMTPNPYTLLAGIFALAWESKAQSNQSYIINSFTRDIDIAEDSLSNVYGEKNARAIIGRTEWQEVRSIAMLSANQNAIKRLIDKQDSFRWEIIREKYT